MRRRILGIRAARQRALVRRARACAGKIARLLKRKYGVGGVFLYGSLARGGFAEHSDIDLLVTGFRGSYWEMLLEAERLARPFRVSIVCEEDASPSLRQEVAREGVPL
ncbi:MAG: nucleotidyltransferase family protein [Desulfotomaculales bacterium]